MLSHNGKILTVADGAVAIGVAERIGIVFAACIKLQIGRALAVPAPNILPVKVGKLIHGVGVYSRWNNINCAVGGGIYI